MKLTPLEQIRALQSALTTGAADYRTHAAHQTAIGNQDGVIFATIRANFLIEVHKFLEEIARNGEAVDDPLCAWTLPSDELQNLADQAAATLHDTLSYNATAPGEAQIAVAAQDRHNADLLEGRHAQTVREMQGRIDASPNLKEVK